MTIYMHDGSNHKIMVHDVFKLDSEYDDDKKKRWRKNNAIINIFK